jgi:hypothetical protein
MIQFYHGVACAIGLYLLFILGRYFVNGSRCRASTVQCRCRFTNGHWGAHSYIGEMSSGGKPRICRFIIKEQWDNVTADGVPLHKPEEWDIESHPSDRH